MDIIKQLLGRLHPLIVHLPIGFIILGLLLQWYDSKRKEHLGVLSLIYLWGALSAVFACITGYLLYLGEGYAFESVKWHLWSGIATALFSFLMYARLRGKPTLRSLNRIPVPFMCLFMLALISFTGHQGGNLTHGEDYLVEPLPNPLKSALGFTVFEQRKISLNEENWEEAFLYEDVIASILNNKCVSCHGPKQSKGELVLHTKEGILKGGENGEVIVGDMPEKSELYTRLILPKEDENHMPPKDKTQLEKEEIQLIRAWIAQDSPFEGSIGDLGLEKKLFQSFFPKKVELDHPDIEIPKATMDSISKIEAYGIHVDNISKATHFLSVSCINKPGFKDSDFGLLRPIAAQISRLDLGGTQITDAVIEKLATLPNLTILKLDHTAITGTTIEKLAGLEHLRSLNLANTAFETSFTPIFSSFKALKKVFLYNTNSEIKGSKLLKDGQIVLDYGNYGLPPIPSDSIVY
ncbi:MAG: c-type cytochrome domain-containing protein [Bacteroidota bacterium]